MYLSYSGFIKICGNNKKNSPFFHCLLFCPILYIYIYVCVCMCAIDVILRSTHYKLLGRQLFENFHFYFSTSCRFSWINFWLHLALVNMEISWIQLTKKLTFLTSSITTKQHDTQYSQGIMCWLLGNLKVKSFDQERSFMVRRPDILSQVKCSFANFLKFYHYLLLYNIWHGFSICS